MITSVFLVYALIDLGLLAYSFSLRSSWPLWLVRAMLFGMCWDNTTLLLADWFIGHSLYELANWPRFVFHAAFLPFLTIYALTMMQRSQIKLSLKPFFIGFCWLFTGCALLYGVLEDVFQLQLEVREFMGHQRLTSASKTPPLATIGTNILILPMALSVWIRGKYPWFFLATLFIFLVNGGSGAQPWGFIAGNAAEVIFTIALIATANHWYSPDPATAPPEPAT